VDLALYLWWWIFVCNFK